RPSVGADEKAVMRECRWLGAERFEDLDLHGRVRDVILAADDVRDGEVDVVDDAGEGIERRAVGADQNGIGERADVDRLLAAHDVMPRYERGQWCKATRWIGIREKEPPVRFFAGGNTPGDLVR